MNNEWYSTFLQMMYDIMMFEWQEHVVNMMGMSLRYEGNARGNNQEIMMGLSGTKLQDQNL
jgi:hypothetical protein